MFLDSSAPRSLFFVCNPKAPDCVRVTRRPNGAVCVVAFTSQATALRWAIENEATAQDGIILLHEVQEAATLGWLAPLRKDGVAGLWIVDEDRWLDLPESTD